MVLPKNLFKSAISLALYTLLSISISAQPFEKTPRLVVNILIKELQTNQITAFYDKLGDNGLKKILKDGSYYPNASFDHLSTFEGGNIATLVTGTQPAVHGLIGGSWYNAIRGHQEWALGLDINNLNDTASLCKLTTKNILCSTVSDELLLINSKQSKVASVGIDITEALITSGHSSQYQFWYDKNNKFATSLCGSDSVPTWVKEFNAKKLPEMYAARWWGPLYDLNSYHEYQAPSKISGANTNRNFLYNLAQMGVNGKLSNYLEGSPYINTIIRDFAVSLIANENYGKDGVTDMITITFNSKPRVRANVSILDAETEDMVLRLDKDIESLLTFLNDWVGRDKYLITLTSTGGSAREPIELEAYNIPTGIFSGKKATSLLSLYLMALYGQNKYIKNYQDGNFYLDKEVFEKNNINFEDVKSKCATFLMQVSGIGMAITNTELNNSVYNEGQKLKIQRSFHPLRSGDILIALKPGWVEEFEIKGSEMIRFSSNDQRIPLAFYGWQIKKQEIIRPISLTSFAPTLSLLLKLNPPNGSEASGLSEVMVK